MDSQTPGGFPATSPAPASTAPAGAAPPHDGWAVPASHGATWWSDGWHIFRKAPLLWIGMTLLVVVLMFVLAMIPVVGQLASTLLYPVLGAGLLLAARAAERGEPVGFGHLFACFDERLGPLLISGVLYLIGWFLVWLLAIAICAAVFGVGSLTALMNSDLSNLGLTALTTMGMVALLALLLVLALGTPLVMAYWFAPPLIALRGDRPVPALKASFAASVRNIPPMLVYGLIGIALAIAATIPFGLGWLVLGPVFVASVYTSYRDIFGSAEK
jgi:uncharacterized membrane protein